MSTAVYPLGMNSMPASGYNHKSTYYNKQYSSWKGTGINSFPIGTVPGHIRPLTNKDPGNVFQTGFGLPRPIKHYRKGRVIPPQPVQGIPNLQINSPNGDRDLNIDENGLINYNMNRFVKSSKGTSLGGGFGGSGLLNEMQDKPGAYIVKQNTCITEKNIYPNQVKDWKLEYLSNNINTQYSNTVQSSTGQYVISVSTNNNTVLTSNDYGKIWTEHTLTNLNDGWGVAISSTGQYQYVASLYGSSSSIYIYISNNYGSTWSDVLLNTPYSNNIIYDTLNTSSDGSIVLLTINDQVSNNSTTYISTNYGLTFTAVNPSITDTILSSKMSSNGQYITLIAGYSGNIYISSDYGSSFNLSTSFITSTMYPMSMSSNGKYQITTDTNGGNIYYSSDYGNVWNIYSEITNVIWGTTTMSGDGKIMLVSGFDNNINKMIIYYSNDYGMTWNLFGLSPGIIPYGVGLFDISISEDGRSILYVTGNNVISLNQIFKLDNYNLNCVNMNEMCKTCEGVGIVASYKPNITNLTQDPSPNATNPIWCCNQEKFAKRRVIYANTNLKKNYYTTTKQYLQNRCKTYDQKSFNFLSYRTNGEGPYDNNNPYYYSTNGNLKPGSPLALELSNTYLANCQLNAQLYEGSENAFIYKMLGIMLNKNIITQNQVDEFSSTGINSIQGFFDWIQGLPENPKESANNVFKEFINNPYWGMPPSGPTNPVGCQLTVYKPNNYQFAKQGAVSSSTRLLKLNVNTISTNASSINNYNNTGTQLVTANELYAGNANNVINLQKNKAPNCNTPWPLNFSQSGRFENKKFCYYKQLPEYQNPATQPSPYRYYPGTMFSTNHFSQSPNTYNTTTGVNAYQ
jgi:hypothetical protein